MQQTPIFLALFLSSVSCTVVLTMMMKFVFLAILASLSSAYVVKPLAVRQPTQLHETFGLGIGEDSYENTPDQLKGEAEYKQWVNKIEGNSFLNRKVRSKFIGYFCLPTADLFSLLC